MSDEQQPTHDLAVTLAEQKDIGNVLCAHQELIALAFDVGPKGLGGGQMAPGERSLRLALEACGVLTSAGALSEGFRHVLSDVIGTHLVRDATIEDFEKVAARYPEWSSADIATHWAPLAYNDRNALKRVRK